MTSKNCLSHWFPLIEAAGAPVPATSITRITRDEQRDIFRVFDGEKSEFIETLAQRLETMATPLGRPFFLRTGQGSGKHNWKNCCCVDGSKSLTHHIGSLIEWSECAGFMGLPWDVWVVREMLPTNPLFRCSRYGDFPVVREFRVFVDGPRVCYHVPYWPDGAVEEGKPDSLDWQDQLNIANGATEAEWQAIDDLASRCGAACGGQWSVDVLDTARGWFVTDMAVAERSYGYDFDRMKEQAT